MNILLDYFMPITSIEPTAQAATGFLKQACIVVSPADDVDPGVIVECTSMADVAEVTDNLEAQQLFNAGMTKVFVLPVDDLLELGDFLEGHESDFYTLLISSDFIDADIASVASAAIKASKKIQDITYTAKLAGTAGNSITINYNTGGTAGSEVVTVVGSAISIAMEDGVSTAAQIKTAVENSVAAMALIDALAVDVGDESDKQAVFGAAVNLENGAAVIAGSSLDVGDFGGVIGLSSTDDAFLALQAVKSKYCAFHTTSGNKAKNMFYAFGKLLSNASSWLNQQYVEMPFSDDVETLGDAESLFEDKISFVIEDGTQGNRLSLFAAGSGAIVAPYIKRNLEIDLQSKALEYISGNQPAYTLKQAALLEDELQKVVQEYIDSEEIESGIVSVTLEDDNFVASASINISEPNAMWRVRAEMRQTL